MEWQEHIRTTAYRWLLGEHPKGCLSENLLLLFGNPDLFDAPVLEAPFERLEKVGVFFKGSYRGVETAFTTPKFGAPAVAMYLEVAALAGVRRAIGLGYVGGLRDDVLVGDLFMPDRAVGIDGTSRSYFGERQEFEATPEICAALETAARDAGLRLCQGTIASIDALMLETTEQVTEWRSAGFGAVDLETACLFGVGAKSGLACAALHIVSDNPFRGDTDRKAAHMSSLTDQVRVALETLRRI